MTRPLMISVICISFAAFCCGDEIGPTFETDIEPILRSKCGKCHNARIKRGDLDLSTFAGLRDGGESGEPVVGESVDESTLWIMIDSGNMPPEGQPRVTDTERKLIHQWIVSGAKSTELHSDEIQLTQHDVLPIVLLRCTACHGPRLKQGGVDLRTPASMKKGGKSGPLWCRAIRW